MHFADDKIKVTQKLKADLFLEGRKYCGKKRRKCYLPTLSSFPVLLSSFERPTIG